ncbi:MAG: nuclear transport factor 2 family protein [Pseudomonadota bacterium]|nr:nuclear transport factor 2 family protein [Pseudomonadota bacterium]
MTNSNLDSYINFYTSLSEEKIANLESVMTEDIHFVDPFNDVYGIKGVEEIFHDMYKKLTNPKFKITNSAFSRENEKIALLNWELTSTLGKHNFTIIGMSEVRFAEDGRVNSHIDHWDSGKQFYQRLPIIGWIIKIIRKRLEA